MCVLYPCLSPLSYTAHILLLMANRKVLLKVMALRPLPHFLDTVNPAFHCVCQKVSAWQWNPVFLRSSSSDIQDFTRGTKKGVAVLRVYTPGWSLRKYHEAGCCREMSEISPCCYWAVNVLLVKTISKNSDIKTGLRTVLCPKSLTQSLLPTY